MLAKDCFSAVCTVGFDPYKGSSTRAEHGKPSVGAGSDGRLSPVICRLGGADAGLTNETRHRHFVMLRDCLQFDGKPSEVVLAAYEQRKATGYHARFYGSRCRTPMLECQPGFLASSFCGAARGPTYTVFTVR